jgi:hypothetical protein
MRKQILALLAFGLISLGLLAQDMESRTYYFPVNGSSFSSEMQADLNAFIKSLDEIKNIEIYGFCDSTGALAINEKLSLRRAGSARTQLLRRGVDKTKVTIKGLGEKSPISENVPNYSFDHNRKVEIVCYVKWNPENDATKIFKKIEDIGTEFIISNQTDTALTTDNGTMIVIAKNSLVTASDRPIKVIVSEYFNKSQLVAFNLTTNGELNNELLHLGNMIKITIVQGEDTIHAGLKTPIQVNIKTDEAIEHVRVFRGIRKINGFVKWFPETKGGGVAIATGAGNKGELPGVESPNDTLKNPKSKVCDSLRQIEDEELVAKFTFFQKIFMFKAKKDGIRAALVQQKANRDSCEACYSAYKSQQLAKKQRKTKMKNIIKLEKERKQNEMSEKDSSGVMALSLDEYPYYTFNITRPGMFNIDKYIKFTQAKIDIVVRDCNQSINAKLVFNDEMSMLPAEKTKDGFIFRDVPSGINVTLFAVRYRDDKIGFYNESFKTDTRAMKFKMEFNDSNLEEIQKEFLKLDEHRVPATN